MEPFVFTFPKYKNNLEATSGKNKAPSRVLQKAYRSSAVDFELLIPKSFYLTSKKMYHELVIASFEVMQVINNYIFLSKEEKFC